MSEFTNEETILHQLIRESDYLEKAPANIRLHGLWYECIVAIGNDHTASIIIDADSLADLRKRCKITPNYGIPSEIADMVTLDEWNKIKGIE